MASFNPTAALMATVFNSLWQRALSPAPTPMVSAPRPAAPQLPAPAPASPGAPAPTPAPTPALPRVPGRRTTDTFVPPSSPPASSAPLVPAVPPSRTGSGGGSGSDGDGKGGAESAKARQAETTPYGLLSLVETSMRGVLTPKPGFTARKSLLGE